MYLYNVKTLAEILITILFDDNDGLDYSTSIHTQQRQEDDATTVICFPSLAHKLTIYL